VSERAWVYRRRVSVDGDGAVLELGGVDHEATVFLDGIEVAQLLPAYDQPGDLAPGHAA
jgi:hypothetical protein